MLTEKTECGFLSDCEIIHVSRLPTTSRTTVVRTSPAFFL